jgi:hypothetical protein
MSHIIKKPSAWQVLMEGRAMFELGAFFASWPFLKTAAKGDGHPVMVLPGFMTDDITTLPLRYFLKDRGFSPHRWRQGVNLGMKPNIEQKLEDRVKRLTDRYGRKVSLVGWSLGGIFAREIAKALPEETRQVISLGSPFAGINQGSNADWMFEILTGEKVQNMDAELVERVMQPPEVPTTAIYSRGDGIVSWQYCKEPEVAPHIENIEMGDSHLGLGHNPLVLLCLANRLSQPEDNWRPFRLTPLGRLWKKEKKAKMDG